METSENRFYQLLSLKVSGEANEEELAELDELIKEDPQLGLEAQMMDEIWKPKPLEKPDHTAFDKHLQRLSNHLSEPVLQYESSDTQETISPVRSLVWKRMKVTSIAASIVVLFIAYNYFISPGRLSKNALKNSVSTRMGSKSNIVLPDGTQVWLNSGSNLTYDQEFLGKERVVTLCGEAFFDVVKDKDRPFVIHTDNIDIRVLGTAFNVRSYPNDKFTETSLIRGSVEVILHDSPEKSIILKPHEKLIVQKDPRNREGRTNDNFVQLKDIALLSVSNLHTLKNDTTTVETSWVKNVLAFDDEPLEQVASKIERWFDVKITIDDEQLKQETYSSVFEDEGLIEVLDALKLTGQFKYSINRKQVLISR